MPMKNKVDSLIKSLGITPYRFAEMTGISKNTVYLLKNNPSQFPSEPVFDRIIGTFPQVQVQDIIEHYIVGSLSLAESPSTYTTKNG